jgi:hypothetical protein
VRVGVELLSQELPGLSAWLDAAGASPPPDAPPELADLIAPLSGGIALGRRLLGETPGDLPVAMLIDALCDRPPTRWIRAIQQALIARSGEPLAWAGCLLRPEGIRARLAGQLDDLTALCDWLRRLPTRPELQSALQKALLSLMWARPAAPVRLQDALVDARSRAVLDLSGRGEGAWERQRSGFLGHSELIGDLFGPLVVVEAAAAAGLDAGGLLERVLAGRAGEGIRYYRGCPELPHDADDAAAILLAARAVPSVGIPPSLRAAAEAVLAEAVDAEGAVSTWIVRGQGPTDWLGPRCVGVAARVVLATGSARSGRWLAGQAQADGGFTATHYPSRVIATALVLRALAPLRSDPAIAAAHAAAAAWLEASRSPDGMLGDSALSTAAALRAGVLSASGTAEAVAALLVRQRWDGQWPEAPLFICPHPFERMRPFSSPMISTAVALAALAGVESQACLAAI